jgi:hypothetical protein
MEGLKHPNLNSGEVNENQVWGTVCSFWFSKQVLVDVKSRLQEGSV